MFMKIFNNTAFLFSNMNRKQKLLITCTIITIVIVLTGATAFTITPPQTDKLQIVATFYPLAFISQEIGGQHVQVTQLVPSNTEIHSWDPSASHIIATEDADIIIYNGAGLDHWLEHDILPALSNTKNRIIVETTSGINLLPYQTHEHAEEEHDHEHGLYDPHTWISPYMVMLQGENIYNAIVQKDPDHQSYYKEQWLNLKNKLEQLDNQYLTQLANKDKHEVFVSHQAFGYLASRYGFDQHGVIGLSADEQPSVAAIANLVDLMQETDTYVIYVDPVYSSKYAQTIKNEIQAKTGQTVNVLNLYLMLGPTDNLNLFEQMQLNLTNLKTGLNAD
jgi:zinc transport system substrate-binding protein